VSAYATAGWENFLVAEVGAAAALVGLVFVAVSINLARILAVPRLPERAAETLLFLFSVLAVGSCGLVPGQSLDWLGREVLALAVACWGIVTTVWFRAFLAREKQPWAWYWPRLLMGQLSTLPFLVGGASMLARSGGGLYWLVPGVLLAFGSGLFNAWVLLIEILR
jgi:modulator of FtsH protease